MSETSTRDGNPPDYSVELDGLPYDSVAVAVVNVVAGYTGTPVEELNPLAEAVDPDALDALLDEAGDDRQSPPTTLLFEYQGLGVRVSATGVIQLVPVDRLKTVGPGWPTPPAGERDG